MGPGRAAVEARDLVVRFRAVAPARWSTALDGVTLRVAEGAFVAVVGPSGAGKTTLLRSLTGFVPVHAGRLCVCGIDVPAATPRQLRALRRQVATIHQAFHLVERADVLSNTLIGRLGHLPTWRGLLGLFPRSDRRDAYATLEGLGLAGRALQRVDTLSGGERQRVAIARALVQGPRLVLADEPAASLDVTLARFVLDTLTELNRRHGVTVVVNLHDLGLARRYAGRLVGMRAGRIVFDGAPAAFGAADEEAIYRAQAQDRTRRRDARRARRGAAEAAA